MKSLSYRHYLIIGIFILAAFFVIAAYDRDLPIAELDEGILLSQTIRDRGLSDFSVYTVTGYPPLILTVFTVTQHIAEFVRQESVLKHAGVVVHTVRILSIFINLATVYLLYRIGDKLGYPIVGAISALIWATLPLVNKQVSQALTEPWQVVFITASAWAMIHTLETKQAKWALICTVLGLLAVLSKYNAFPVLGFGVGTSLWLLISTPRKRLWGLALAVQGILIIGTAVYLWFFYGASELLSANRPEVSQFVGGGIQSFVDASTILYIFSTASTEFAFPHLILLVLILLLGLGFLFSKVENKTRVAVLFMLIFVIVFIWMVPGYLVYDVLKYRYISPASSLMVLLIGLALWHLSRMVVERTRHPQLLPVIFLLMSGIWLAPSAWDRLNELWQMQYPRTDIAVVKWSQASLESDATIAITGHGGNKMHWRNFNNVWGDYTGPNRPLLDILLYLQEPKDVWLDTGIEYVHLTGEYPGDFPTLPFSRDDMLLIKAFPPPDTSQNWRGEPWYIYRLQSFEYTSQTVFGDAISLKGYDLSDTTVSPGDQISLRLFWMATQTPSANYHLFVHLSDLDEHTTISQVDGTPGLLTRMTSTWDDPNETLVSPAYQLPIPAELAPGEYRILVGLYHPETGQRLMTDTGTDAIELHRINIVSPD